MQHPCWVPPHVSCLHALTSVCRNGTGLPSVRDSAPGPRAALYAARGDESSFEPGSLPSPLLVTPPLPPFQSHSVCRSIYLALPVAPSQLYLWCSRFVYCCHFSGATCHADSACHCPHDSISGVNRLRVNWWWRMMFLTSKLLRPHCSYGQLQPRPFQYHTCTFILVLSYLYFRTLFPHPGHVRIHLTASIARKALSQTFPLSLQASVGTPQFAQQWPYLPNFILAQPSDWTSASM